MFDFAWSEFALIGVVALILIGPKDLPVAVKAVTDVIKKARRMAAEFQTHVDEMVREADLHEVRDQLNELRNFDIKGELEKAVDPDGTLRQTFTENPLEPTPAPVAVETQAEAVIAAPVAPIPEEPEGPPVPAFIPPQIARPPAAPAFMPPGAQAPRPRV